MWRPAILTRTTGATLAERPSHTLFYWLVGAFLLSLLPHVEQLPGWLSISIAAAVAVRAVAEWKRWPLPSTASTGVVAICLLGGIYLQYHTIVGKDAGTPFMAGLLTIKFYELRQPRDITLIIFSSFFVVMSALLFSQAIELFVYCLIMMWLLTGILLRTYMGDRPESRLLRMLRLSLVIFLQALPFALLLFFFLPRYVGRFPLSFNDATTGLTDHVEPGSIAKLANDDSPAMRVYFHSSSIPSPDTMYWRAIVLWHFDGNAWTRGPHAERVEKQPAAGRDSDIVQDIIIWPQGQRWVPALDRPTTLAEDRASPGPWTISLSGDVLVPRINNEVIDYKRQYTVVSSFTINDEVLSDEEKDYAIELPGATDPRVIELADRLYAPFRATGDTAGYYRAVLSYFHRGHFTLSTEPGRLGRRDPVAEFLFQTRIGFCEHYASAFAVLMRLEKIPTRMVVGYRGGELNSYGGFYLVSQSNAHVWDEVWIDAKKSWVRIDPTTAVSNGTPRALAVNSGMETDDDLSLQLANHRFTLLSAADLPPFMRRGLRDIAMRRQDMEAQWDDWVFSYDPGAQDRLAQAMGFGRRAWVALLAACLVVVGGLGAAIAFFLSRKKALSPVEKFYARLCRRMAQRGVPREPWEGPLTYTSRLAETFPAQRKPIENAGRIVTYIRYGDGAMDPPRSKDLDSLLTSITASDRASSSGESN